MTKTNWRNIAEDAKDPATLLKCIADRVGGQLHIKLSEIEPVQMKALVVLVKDDKIIVRTGTAEQLREWPDEKRIDEIGQNGNDGIHYSELPELNRER